LHAHRINFGYIAGESILIDFSYHIRFTRLFGLKGLFSNILGKISGRPRKFSFRRNGVINPISMRTPSSDTNVFAQIFLQAEYQFEVKAEPKIIIDAGANIGLASIYFANRFPSAKIFAIECELSNFDILQQNVKPYKNIIPIHAALWDENGEIQVVDPGLGKWGFMTATKTDGSDKSSSVRALTLHSIMREYNIPHIDILKVDIEGAELEVFNASSSWIDNVDTIIAELHDGLKSGCEQSFTQATSKFTERWQQGENVYVSRSESCVVCGV
jgi:FkbM family methyltransferase